MLFCLGLEVEDAIDDRPGHPADVVTGGRFDLDDVGPKVGEEGGHVSGSEQARFDDSDAAEKASGSVRWLVAASEPFLAVVRN